MRHHTLPLDTNEKLSKNQNSLQSYINVSILKLNSSLCIMGNTLTWRANEHRVEGAYPILNL